MMRRCILRCRSDSHAPIALPDGVEILIGRSKLTRIQDQACSRQQISLKADYTNSKVQLKQLGVNPSGLDGFCIKRGSSYDVGHGSKVEILLNKYPHLIEFDPPPDNHGDINSKRRLEEGDTVKPDKVPKLDASSTPSAVTSEKTWENIDNGELYIFTSKGVKSSSKIASYDMDGTIIKTRSGKVHPVDMSDWQIAFSEVHSKLKSHHHKGFKVVFLTNQAPIGKGRVKIEDFKKKMEAIVDKLGVPVQAFVATGRGMYRKPMTGMWDVLVEEGGTVFDCIHFYKGYAQTIETKLFKKDERYIDGLAIFIPMEKNNNLPIDMISSFYCGDAAGRTAGWAPGKKKDHSMADRLLAENVGLPFYTPEEHFLDHPRGRVPVAKPDFDPRELSAVPFDKKLISSEQEVLVLVGYPGSGKSFLARWLERESGARYVAVCRDTLGSWQKCASEATRLLQAGKSVVVDCTNPDEESRARWTAVARVRGAACRCARLAASYAHARHNNKFRELLKESHAQVTDMVFHSYKKKFKEPSVKEGFKEVLSVPFCPSFDNEQSEKLYKMHLLEH